MLDGFTSGGAQVTGGVNQKDVELSSDFNYVRGMHTMRTGIQLEGRHYRTDSASNYLGTYIFSSNEDFQIGKARNYTRRVGDPLITFRASRGGGLRAGRSAPAAEPDVQSRLAIRAADARPRPHRLWSAARIDVGARQERPHDHSHELRHLLQLARHRTSTSRRCASTASASRKSTSSIRRYPDLGGAATVSATNKYVLGDLTMERIHRYSAAIDRTFSPKVRGSMTFSLGRYGNQLRGVNLNAPVNGVRPDPAFANVIEVVARCVDAHL